MTDELLETIKELRPKVTRGDWLLSFPVDAPIENVELAAMSVKMADLCISQAEKIERLDKGFNPDYDCKAILAQELKEAYEEIERLRDENQELRLELIQELGQALKESEES